LLQLANLVSRQVDGILLAYTSERTKAIRFSKEIAVPFVFIDRPVPGEYSVATDNYHGGQLAARHLVELGHRCIGMLCGEAEIQNVAERIDGFQTELRRSGFEVSPAYMLHGRQELQLGIRVAELLAMEPRPTAVFATNDIVAVGAWRTLLEAGFRVPQDFSIVGFDDIEISRFLVPPLTTVGQPTSEMGAKAVDLLLQLMSHQAEDGNKVATNFLVAPTLFIRGSTATPSTNK